MSQIILDAMRFYLAVAAWIFFEYYEIFMSHHLWLAFGAGILLAIVAYNIAGKISLRGENRLILK